MIRKKLIIMMSIFAVSSFMYMQEIHAHKGIIKKDIAYETVLEDQICKLVTDLNDVFTKYEQENPQQGYCVTIETTHGLVPKVIPCGGRRATKLLSGFSDNKLHSEKNCPFCKHASSSVQHSALMQFDDTRTCAVKSLSNQILVIPVEHYDHFFSTPFDVQVIILKNIFAVRHMHGNKIQRPIEFHCGSAAGQTVFHLHGRTGVYVE